MIRFIVAGLFFSSFFFSKLILNPLLPAQSIFAFQDGQAKKKKKERNKKPPLPQNHVQRPKWYGVPDFNEFWEVGYICQPALGEERVDQCCQLACDWVISHRTINRKEQIQKLHEFNARSHVQMRNHSPERSGDMLSFMPGQKFSPITL